MQRVDNRLRTLERRNFGTNSLINVAVVGCGYSGVELAATISERLQDRGIVKAINVATTICPQAPPGNRETALKVSYIAKFSLLIIPSETSVVLVGQIEIRTCFVRL